MKNAKIIFLIVISLFTLLLVSCIPGSAQPIGGWSGATVHDNTIYIGSRDGRVVAINASTEVIQWSYHITEPSDGIGCGPAVVSAAIFTTPIVDGDFVYIGTYSGKVLALNTTARSQNLNLPAEPQDRYHEWETPIGTDARNTAIVADLVISGDVLYVSGSDGRVYSLRKDFGDQVKKSGILDERHSKLWTSPVIEDDTLYVSTFDGNIYALSAETLELLEWSFKLEAGFASSPVICENTDTMFLGSFDRHLYAVKIGSDVLEWRFPEEPAGNWFWASPVVNEGIVYAGCLDGKLYAIEADTSREIWSYPTEDQNGKPSPIVSSPVLMGNLLIVVNESGTVYVFDLDGELANEGVPWWTTSIGAGVRSSFCAQEGLVYIRGEDNQLYIVDIGNRQVSQPIPLTAEA
ncbi:MAG TPA: PQQ-binding-like beta-propeller repeat protein [Dehalococcoidia bacterium]|nr:PQQ-binding-like beta-propeller repeat protein [Dehalococcoidia bacterium]